VFLNQFTKKKIAYTDLPI